MSTLRIKLKRSVHNCSEKQEKVLRALGLRKIGMIVEQKDNPQIRGMINKVAHMIEVESVGGKED